MLKITKKIAILLMFALCFCIATPKVLCAQSFKVQSATDFAKSHGAGQDIMNVLEGEKTGQVTCGNTERICDTTKNQVCVRCKQHIKVSFPKIGPLEFDPFSWVIDRGKCENKSVLDSTPIKTTIPMCSTSMNKEVSLEEGVNLLKENGVDLGDFGRVMAKFGDRTLMFIHPSISTQITYEATGFISSTSFSLIGIDLYEHKETFTDSSGKKYGLVMEGGSPIISYNEKGFNGCEVLPVKLYKMQSCFFCPMAQMIFKTANNVTATSFAHFAESFKVLMAIIFALWLALVALQQAFPLTKKDASDFIEMIIKQGFKFLLAVVLLTNAGELFRMFIVPILNSGLKMGAMLQTNSFVPLDRKPDVEMIVIEPEYFNMKVAGGKTLQEQLEYYLSAIQGQMSYLQTIGTTLFCVGTKHIVQTFADIFSLKTVLAAGNNITEGFVNGISMMFLGGFFLVVGILFSLVFAFYFLDAMLQLGLLGIMLPLMIAGWPFKITSSYAGKGLNMLLNSFFVFFFTGFVVSVVSILIDQSLAFSQGAQALENIKGDVSADQIKDIKEGAQGLSSIATALNNQNTAELSKAISIGGTGYLLLAFASLFGFKFMSQVSPLAQKFASGAMGKGFASSIGTMATSAATNFAKKAAGKTVGAAASSVAGGFAKAGGVSGMVGGALNKAGNFAGDAFKAAGMDKAAARAGKVADAGSKLKSHGQKIYDNFGG